MEPVVTVNLNGNSYSLDQSAYDALRAYLDTAEAALKDNPDRAEILRDLEQAIAEKCAAYLSPHKSVVSADEMKRALAEMGPVEGAEHVEGATGEQPRASSGEAPKKKLYRIPDGAVVAGICSGLSAYLAIDVTVIRVLMVIGGFLTGGWLLLAYVVAMFVIPTAHTSEDWAAAHGIPFNAQEVIDRAKRQYADFTDGGPPWSRSWRRQRREWRRAARWGYGPRWGMPPSGPPASYAGRVAGGFLLAILAIVRIVLIVAFIIAIVSVSTGDYTNYVWGWPAVHHVPTWQAILVLIAVWAIISIPLRALRWAGYSMSGARYGYHGGDGFFGLLAVIVVGWVAYNHIPEAHLWMDHARDALTHAWEDFRHDVQ